MTWSSFEKDKLLTESWRKFLHEEDQTVYGINSEQNTESLISFLSKNKDAIRITDEQITKIIDFMLAQTEEDEVVLEAMGDPQRDARTFSSDTTTKLNSLIDEFKRVDKTKLEKVLNRWAKLNTVKFEKPAAVSSAAPDEAPSEEPPATPSSNTTPTSSEPEATTTSKNPEKEGPEFIYFFDTNRASGEVADLKSAWNQRFGKQRTANFKRDLKKFADFVGPYVNFNESDIATALSESNKFRKELKNFTKAAPGYFMDDNQFTGALIKRVEKDNSTKRIILSLLKLRGGRFNRETIRKVLSGLITNLRRRKN